MNTQSLFEQVTNTQFLLHALGTLSVVAFFVTLDWSIPGLIWGMTISQFFYGIAYYAAWQWPRSPQLRGTKTVVTKRNSRASDGFELNPPLIGNNPDKSNTGDIEESFLISLAFFILMYGMTFLMTLSFAWALFPLTDNKNDFIGSIYAAMEIYWPIIIIVFIARFRELPWGGAYERDSFFPFLPNAMIGVIMKAPIIIIVGAIIANQGWDIYGPTVLLFAAMYFFEPQFGNRA